MTLLEKPRHPLIERALRDVRRWSVGHVIDDRPAMAHAVAVAATIGRHAPHAAPELIAAALLHDLHDFAVPRVAELLHGYGPRVPWIIDELRAEHAALDGPVPPSPAEDPDVLLASTADRVVALTSLLRRAHRCGDVTGFFAARPALLRLLGHFRAGQRAGVGRVPAGLSAELAAVLDRLDLATTALHPGDRAAPPPPAIAN
jgi:hypothetical protein